MLPVGILNASKRKVRITMNSTMAVLIALVHSHIHRPVEMDPRVSPAVRRRSAFARSAERRSRGGAGRGGGSVAGSSMLGAVGPGSSLLRAELTPRSARAVHAGERAVPEDEI